MTKSIGKLPESIYRTVLDAMEHGYVFMGPDGVIRSFNDAACRILGLSADQLVGKTSADPHWGSVREDGSDFPADEHPIMISLKTHKPCFGVVMGIRFNVDRTRWLSINSDAVRDEETGEILGAVATFSDITPQIEQNRYLEQSVEDLQSSARATTQNVSYMMSTLLSLVGEIASANHRLMAAVDDGDDTALEYAGFIARKVEKLTTLLARPRA